MTEFQIEARRYTDPDVQRLVECVQAEYVQRYGGPDEAAVDPSEFDPPAGLFLLGSVAGVPVAMGGWRRLSSDEAEIKRMYVATEARRQRLGRRLLTQLEASAAAAGIARLVLNTGTEQPEAMALYEDAGYVAAPAYGHYAIGYPKARFYGKSLDGLSRG